MSAAGGAVPHPATHSRVWHAKEPPCRVSRLAAADMQWLPEQQCPAGLEPGGSEMHARMVQRFNPTSQHHLPYHRDATHRVPSLGTTNSDLTSVHVMVCQVTGTMDMHAQIACRFSTHCHQTRWAHCPYVWGRAGQAAATRLSGNLCQQQASCCCCQGTCALLAQGKQPLALATLCQRPHTIMTHCYMHSPAPVRPFCSTPPWQ